MTVRVDSAVTAMSGPAAPPRKNGELVFEAPWQGRAFGMALGVVERLGLEWAAFQQRLISAIAAHPETPYYDCWVAALEQLMLDYGVASMAEMRAAQEEESSLSLPRRGPG
jgi:nitrile hydratase accessory protein